jgi:hypothetical protein
LRPRIELSRIVAGFVANHERVLADTLVKQN